MTPLPPGSPTADSAPDTAPPARPPSASPPTETELKLSVTEAGMAALTAHPLITPEGDRRPPARRLVTWYHDTPDAALLAAGLALRVRKANGRHRLCVKGLGNAQQDAPMAGESVGESVGESGAPSPPLERETTGGLSRRPEWEVPCPGPDPDLSRLPAPEPRDRLLALVGDRPLAPLYVTDIKRIARTVPLPQAEDAPPAQVEIALDLGEIRAGDLSLPVCEVELELKEGSARALFDLALVLAESVALLPATESKAARGIGLAVSAGLVPAEALPRPAGSRKNRPAPLLTPDLSAMEAVRCLGRAGLARLLDTRPTVLAGQDPEGVHQMRVAIRRLRSMMSLFRPLLAGPDTEAVTEDLRWLMGILGPARDSDVFVTEVLTPLAPRLAEEPGWPALAAHFEAERQRNSEAAIAAVDSPRFSALLLRAHQWLELGAWTED